MLPRLSGADSQAVSYRCSWAESPLCTHPRRTLPLNPPAYYIGPQRKVVPGHTSLPLRQRTYANNFFHQDEIRDVDRSKSPDTSVVPQTEALDRHGASVLQILPPVRVSYPFPENVRSQPVEQCNSGEVGHLHVVPPLCQQYFEPLWFPSSGPHGIILPHSLTHDPSKWHGCHWNVSGQCMQCLSCTYQASKLPPGLSFPFRLAQSFDRCFLHSFNQPASSTSWYFRFH